MAVEPRLHNIPHSMSTLTIKWSASGPDLEATANESWAIDNVEVVLHGLIPVPARVVEVPPAGWRPTTGVTAVGTTGRLVGTRPVSVTSNGQVIAPVDFANVPAVVGLGQEGDESAYLASLPGRSDSRASDEILPDLIDWSGTLDAARSSLSARPASPWIRPFLLEAAGDATDDWLDEIRLELSEVARDARPTGFSIPSITSTRHGPQRQR